MIPRLLHCQIAILFKILISIQIHTYVFVHLNLHLNLNKGVLAGSLPDGPLKKKQDFLSALNFLNSTPQSLATWETLTSNNPPANVVPRMMFHSVVAAWLSENVSAFYNDNEYCIFFIIPVGLGYFLYSLLLWRLCMALKLAFNLCSVAVGKHQDSPGVFLCQGSTYVSVAASRRHGILIVRRRGHEHGRVTQRWLQLCHT